MKSSSDRLALLAGLKFGLTVVVWAVVARVLWFSIAQTRTDFSWYQCDLVFYQKAGEALRHGIDPYTVAGFFYPPVTLPGCALFSMLTPLDRSTFAWGLQVVSMAAILWMVARYFLRDIRWVEFLLFILFAFQGAALFGTTSGNISTVETLTIWCAIAFYLRRNYALFAALIVAAALPKYMPIALLGLVLLTDDKRRWAYFWGGVGAEAIVIAMSALLVPHLTLESVHVSLAHGNPYRSTFGLMPQLVKVLPLHMAYAAYAGIAALMAYTTDLNRSNDARANVATGLLCYCVLLPNSQIYSYALAVPAAYYVLRQQPRWIEVTLMLVICFNASLIWGQWVAEDLGLKMTATMLISWLVATYPTLNTGGPIERPSRPTQPRARGLLRNLGLGT